MNPTPLPNLGLSESDRCTWRCHQLLQLNLQPLRPATVSSTGRFSSQCTSTSFRDHEVQSSSEHGRPQPLRSQSHDKYSDAFFAALAQHYYSDSPGITRAQHSACRICLTQPPVIEVRLPGYFCQPSPTSQAATRSLGHSSQRPKFCLLMRFRPIVVHMYFRPLTPG